MSHPSQVTCKQSAYDFTVLELQRRSSFKPIKFAASDGSDIKDGEIVAKLGWDSTGGEGQHAHELQRADVKLISNEECSKQTSVDETAMCSAPIGNQSSCLGDYGGPVIVERPDGDVLLGSISWSLDCGKSGYPSYYMRLPSGKEWIESVIKGECISS